MRVYSFKLCGSVKKCREKLFAWSITCNNTLEYLKGKRKQNFIVTIENYFLRLLPFVFHVRQQFKKLIPLHMMESWLSFSIDSITLFKWHIPLRYSNIMQRFYFILHHIHISCYDMEWNNQIIFGCNYDHYTY